jgi:hypothetical protein
LKFVCIQVKLMVVCHNHVFSRSACHFQKDDLSYVFNTIFDSLRFSKSPVVNSEATTTFANAHSLFYEQILCGSREGTSCRLQTSDFRLETLVPSFANSQHCFCVPLRITLFLLYFLVYAVSYLFKCICRLRNIKS